MTNRHDWPTGVSVNLGPDTVQRIAELAAVGIHSMELCGGRTWNYDNFPQAYREIAAAAQAHGLEIRSLHLPFLPFEEIDPASKDAAVRENFLRVQQEILQVVAGTGIPIAVVHPSGEPYREDREIHLAHAIESLTRLNEMVKAAGMKLAIENLPRTCICRDCAEIRQVAEAIPDAYFCFDANHSLFDQNEDVIAAMGERIIALHISDYDRIDERHWFPGEGVNSWQSLMACLEAVNYQGAWTYEISKSNSIPAERFVENHTALLTRKIP